jgi:hypothetical protein
MKRHVGEVGAADGSSRAAIQGAGPPQVGRQRAAASVCCHGQQRVVFDARMQRTSTANNIPQPTLTATESTLGGSCAVFPGY